MKPTAIFAAWLVAAGVSIYAQKPPVRPATGNGTTTSTPSNTPTNTFPTNTTTTNNNPSSLNLPERPIYLSGKVVLQDGTPPPDLVKIERVCAGTPRFQGYTDSKGRFQFQLDSPIGADTDASDPMTMTKQQGVGSRPMGGSIFRGDLSGCDLRAVLPGFLSGTVSLAGRGSFDSPDVGIIVLRRTGTVDGTTVSMTSLKAPANALKAYERGRELVKKDKTEEAERSFQKAVEIYPAYAVAWYQLGLLQSRAGSDQAEVSFGHAIEADPKFVSPYLSWALICERSKRWQKALELTTSVVKLNGIDFPQAHFFQAVAHYNLGDTAQAELSVRRAIELDIRHEYAQSEKLLGVVLFGKNDLTGSAEHFRKYLEIAPNAADAQEVRAQLSKVEQKAVALKEPR